MGSFDFVNLAVLVLAVGGLAVVLWEVLVKAPVSVLEMMEDSRRFAEAPVAEKAAPTARRSTATPAAATVNHPPRIAA